MDDRREQALRPHQAKSAAQPHQKQGGCCGQQACQPAEEGDSGARARRVQFGKERPDVAGRRRWMGGPPGAEHGEPVTASRLTGTPPSPTGGRLPGDEVDARSQGAEPLHCVGRPAGCAESRPSGLVRTAVGQYPHRDPARGRRACRSAAPPRRGGASARRRLRARRLGGRRRPGGRPVRRRHLHRWQSVLRARQRR